jgi:hypothetical protein
MTETKHAGGRPLTYSDDMVIKAKEYLALCVGEYETLERPIVRTIKGRQVEDIEKFVVHTGKVPTKGGLAVYLNVARETLYAWAKEYQEFSDVMEKLGADQEEKLINNGLNGSYNPTIAKVLLTKHGYREGVDATTNDKDLSAVLVKFIGE